MQTLSWTDAEFVEPDLRETKADIDTLQRIFSEQNRDLPELEFEILPGH
ncbi:MAG: hypothetical protein U5R06_11240 [candidate division KSB1 bacterium]|nr:hypothetical protein [candidate division KSB1 bacterium]